MFGAVLALFGLAVVGLSPSRADIHYQGGFVTTHHYGDPYAQPPAPQIVVPMSPSTFPDGDDYYPSFSGRAEAVPPQPSPTGSQSYYFSSAMLPWNQGGIGDYEEPLRLPQDTSLIAPKRYALEAAALSSALPAVPSESALLIAHLPEHAILWVEGTRTQATGRTRYFESPPLQPGPNYGYTVRAAWIEDGRWGSQTRMVPVRAGRVEAIYLRPVPVPPLKIKAETRTLPTKSPLMNVDGQAR